MKKLIERLEKATGPDRKLDRDIGVQVLGWEPFVELSIVGPLKRLRIDGDEYPDHVASEYPSPTESIDAALALVPDLTWLEIETGTQIEGNNFNWPIIACGSQHTGSVFWKGQAATFAITLCIAALKARAAPPPSPANSADQ